MMRQLLLKFRAALVMTVAFALAASALAQATVVTGTGNPGVDRWTSRFEWTFFL